ncbi:methionine ABC transporter ATP-binding protein [Bhargavaea cecembensis]|uniref:Methionine ABC transporter ATP-binding protein n=1 Tax=Bhargavaea cecembensis TaxID=394098 RepID=A0A165GHZ8_9BACL|nr:ATP-binding cassette domain-containing protein [Bhargavaea cecembensis]KZE36465.1 methionine ABC transporter ATP-binding protein [Bhargavaea cecembensis]
MIKLEQITKQFRLSNRTLTAVDAVDLEIREGEIFGIIGYSGAGKSTLIRMLNGLEKPTGGRVTVNGMEMSSISGADLRKARQKVSMIFQHFNLLWSRTVAENIAFPLEIAGVNKAEREPRVRELIRLVGLEGREDAYPSELSGGQKQRVGIARALANEPDVLLCDEATSALDPETTDSILDLLTDINKRLNLTIVLITHEMHVIRKICHRVAVMEAGRVVEMGDVLQVFRSPQQPITKRFVSQVTESPDVKQAISQLVRENPDGTLIRLGFVGERTGEPVLARLIRTFDIDVNILQANVSQTHGGTFGSIILNLVGDEPAVAEAVEFLHSEGVETEVIERD